MLWLSIVFLEILLFEFIFESTIVMNYLSLVNLQVLSRLAPFERGIYEDYVANFWCTTSVLVKWKRIFTIQSLKLLSLGATVSTCLPSMVQQIWAPSNQGFLYGLLNSAFSFYMFSFQGKSSFFYFLNMIHFVLPNLSFHSIVYKNYFHCFNLQCMRSQFCCLSCLQAFWHWKSLFFLNGLHFVPCSLCFLFFIVTSWFYHILLYLLSSSLLIMCQVEDKIERRCIPSIHFSQPVLCRALLFFILFT